MYLPVFRAHVSDPLNTKKWLSECRLFMYVCMCPSLAPERLDGFYSYSVVKSLSVRGQRLVNLNVISTKIGALQMPHFPKLPIFSKMALTHSTKF
jgi:hypothetical protein